MADFVKVKGLKELDRKLAKLPQKTGLKAMRSAMMAATRPMFVAAKANAAATGVKGFDAGSTAAAMGRWVRKVTPTTTVLFLGPKNKNKKALALWNAAHGKQAARLRHFHLVEFGSINGPAQPFLRPAFDGTKFLVLNSFGRELKRAIEKLS